MIRATIPLALLIAWTAPMRGQDFADEKTIEAIRKEIELVPSFYGSVEKPMKAEPLPKFSAQTLRGYASDNTLGKERELFMADKDGYAKKFPLRATVFGAVEVMEKYKNRTLPMMQRSPVTMKDRAAVEKTQRSVAEWTFELENALSQMKAAEEHRAKETSKRWRANFDFVVMRVQTDAVFLIEYNWALSKIRQDDLPALAVGEPGWMLTSEVRVTVNERKAKDFWKDNKKRWEKIQKDYPDTPWSYFAKRDSDRPMGMQWRPAEK